jgi:hypothetical protein
MKTIIQFLHRFVLVSLCGMAILIPGCNSSRRTPRQEFGTAPKTETAAADARQDTTLPAAPPKPLGVSEWTGRRFVLLEKVKMFRRFGYPLYLSPSLDSTTGTFDTTVALADSRLRYEPFAGTMITVDSVTALDNGEYGITATTDTLGLTVYGRTTDGTIEGLCLAQDLPAARARWKGATVYPRRRLVDSYDSAASRFSGIKVSITRPLTVTDVRWGMIPLPPKPIWLVVRDGDSLDGIIPVHYSWTNVQEKSRVGTVPWDEEILEENPRETWQWDSLVWEAIDKASILSNMTTGQVRLSWGEPAATDTTYQGLDELIHMVYEGDTLTFVNDTLDAP